jgi:hypothetical protein
MLCFRKEMKNIEILAQTEYQDLYRISDGVLLVINKFKPIDYSDKTTRHVRVWFPKAKYKTYYKGCQQDLKELKEDYYDEYCTLTIKKGTVLYNGRPVIITDNKANWKYEVKTTGSSLGGNFDIVDNMLSNILRIIRIT